MRTVFGQLLPLPRKLFCRTPVAFRFLLLAEPVTQRVLSSV